jgi:hypothetical protein
MRYFLYLFAACLMLVAFWGCQSNDALVDPTSDGINNPGDSDGRTDHIVPLRRYWICGTVFIDENENGVQDEGEEGMAGVDVYLVDGPTTTTDENGDYHFYPVYNGDYTVGVDVPAGYSPTTPPEVDVTVNGASVCDVDFGLIYTGPGPGPGEGDLMICGTVTMFMMKFGQYPIPDVTVVLVYDNEDVETTTTDENGQYCFDDLGEGDYCVRVDGVQVLSTNPQCVTLTDEDVTGIDFRIRL